MRLFVPGVVAAISVFGIAHAEPDSLQDMLGPREIAVGEAMRGSATGASSIGMNPAGLPLNRELVFEGSYGYRGSDSASLVNVSACDSTNAVPGCFFYSFAGATDALQMDAQRTTHVAGSSLSRLLVPRVTIGATAKYFRHSTEVVGESNAKGFSFDFGATIRLASVLNLGLIGQNMFGTEDSIQFPRSFGGGITARPIPSVAVSFDSRWKTADGEARYGGGGELFLRGGQLGFPIRVGGVHDNGLGATYVTGGIGIADIKWGLDLAARKQISGGSDETLILASMRVFGPRLEALPME